MSADAQGLMARPALMLFRFIDGIMAMQSDRESPVEFTEVFKRGDAVQIVDGPFAGLDAIFQAQSGKERVLLLLDLLGRSNKITVSPDQVAPAC